MTRCTREHLEPEGPNEDLSMCPTPDCWWPTSVLRPEGEQYALHIDDCSLELRHRGYCAGGGAGHAPVAKVRGWWGPSTEADIQAARDRFKDTQ